MTTYEVVITLGAARDLTELHDYVLDADGFARADRLLDRIADVIATLEAFPERGSHPRELLDLGIHGFRQIVSHPYRIIYQVVDHRVFIYLIADGRRDMRSLLTERLLWPQ